VVAAADDRTNTVVVSGPADTLKVVEGVVKELDANPQDEKPAAAPAVKPEEE